MIAASIRVDVRLDDTQRFRRGLRQRLSRAVRAETLATQADAQQRAPVKTGTLRRSIRAEFPAELVGVVAVHVEYGKDVEYGTHKQAAQPYVTPAAEVARRRFPKRIQEALRDAA